MRLGFATHICISGAIIKLIDQNGADLIKRIFELVPLAVREKFLRLGILWDITKLTILIRLHRIVSSTRFRLLPKPLRC